MTDITLSLTDAIIARLKADVALTGLVAGRVFDEVPPDAAFPYIQVEIGSVENDPADGGYEGYVIYPKISIYSRATGTVELKLILGQVLASLCGGTGSPPFTLSSGTLKMLCRYLDTFGLDGDGVTRTCVAMLKAVAEA
ncbi:MAG: DUF3168 domain-containing protein [Alphaproteobacteria bacterium]|nr:DUF3168 domain-containing protein [Alphaproteobacteria bacterium]